MVDNRKGYSDSMIFNEMSDNNRNYWFDFKRQKFLHNIDTFYYSVKLDADFRRECKDFAVENMRFWFENKVENMEDSFGSGMCVYFDGWESNLVLRSFTYAGYFKYCISDSDLFDIFFAPVVPPGSDGGESVTCEIVVQIRSYCLWMHGVCKSFEMTYDYVGKMLDFFHIEAKYTQENRCDYCWHSNYFSSPERFFAPDNFYQMRVDRFKGATFHTEKAGSSGHEIDYIALGKRSDKVFVRIYLKSKEVVEMGYKPWFFKVWLFNGLINRYDFYVYEECYKAHSWRHLDMARIQFYSEYGSDAGKRAECMDVLKVRKRLSPDSLHKLAERLTPRVNLVVNVEYQVMRRHSKSYVLLPLKDNSVKGIHKRIYDFFDNRSLIIDYLTHDVFRLVKKSDESDDSNKSRREDCAFWHALRRTKLVDCCVKPEEVRLCRDYKRNLNAEVVKHRALKSAITLGLYNNPYNANEPVQDMIDALCILNDNDIKEARRFKGKKLRQFSEKEMAQLSVIESPVRRFSVFDAKTGEIL